MKMIVKVQVALESSMKNPPALVYNKDRSVVMELPVNDEIRLMMEGQPKRYFEAEVEGDSLLIIGDADPQPW